LIDATCKKKESIKICLDLQKKVNILLVKICYFCTSGKTSVKVSTSRTLVKLGSLFASCYRSKRKDVATRL